jgi:hypothetical protein
MKNVQHKITKLNFGGYLPPYKRGLNLSRISLRHPHFILFAANLPSAFYSFWPSVRIRAFSQPT